MIKKLKEKLKKKNGAKEDVDVQQRSTLRERVESHAEAITFAEAGIQETAREIIREDIAERAKVLVVGSEEGFSRPVVDYAIGFAERMGYEIVALNVGPVADTANKALGPYCDIICEQFKKRCGENIQAFKEACENRGIPFRHVVKFGHVDDCIKEVHEELKRVEFVITEPDSCPEEGKVAIPVFCMT